VRRRHLDQPTVREHEPLQLTQPPVDPDHVAALVRPVEQLIQILAQLLNHWPTSRIQAEPRQLTGPLTGQLLRERLRKVRPPTKRDRPFLDHRPLAALPQLRDLSALPQRQPPRTNPIDTVHQQRIIASAGHRWARRRACSAPLRDEQQSRGAVGRYRIASRDAVGVLLVAGVALRGFAGALVALVVCGLAWGLFDRRRRAAP
jgi:hypothetical protein